MLKMYIIRWMRARPIGPAVMLVLALTGIAACGTLFGHEYEYEEQLYLSVNGSATVTVDASVAALVALRGLALDPSPRAFIDSARVRQVYEAAGCHVTRVGRPWSRHGRRFVEVEVSAGDVRTLSSCGPLAWSTYTFDRTPTRIRYEQVVGASAGGDPKDVQWTGKELVAFKLHLPSRITFHNVRRLADNAPGEIGNGNILTWEQYLSDRRRGAPVDMQVEMEPESILHRTLWLFGGSFAAAVLVMVGLIWWTIRKGKARVRAAQGPAARSPRP